MKIAVLIPTHAHVYNAKNKSRRSPNKYYGLQIIIDKINEVYPESIEFIDFSRVDEFDIILFSMLSVDDYYSLVYTVEKKLKYRRKNIWICGGPGIANINPLIPYFDFIVLGRGEDIILPLMEYISNYFVNLSYHSEVRNLKLPSGVINSFQYDSELIYHQNYSKHLFEGSQNAAPEKISGCKYNCLYCRYRSSSLPPKLRESSQNTTMPGNEETFWELEIKNGSFYTTSLDGLLENTRKVVHKNIPNKSIVDKIVASSLNTKVINLKIYFIVGYPHDKSIDFSEFIDVCHEIDTRIKDCQVFFSLHFTPFAAEPHTPMQWEAVDISIDYRELFNDMMKINRYLYNGVNVRAMIMRTCNKPLTLLKRMIYNRSTLDDLNILQFISSDSYMISHSRTAEEKLNYLLSKFDVTKFIKEYGPGTSLPTDNIIVWKPRETMIKECLIYRKKIHS
jgi:radical SAM superfamily enzyme YgiQ (UPF0313 family)